MDLNLAPLVTSLLSALIITLGGLIWNTGKKVDRLLEIMGSTDEPTSVLGRIYVVEQENRRIKEKLIANGYKFKAAENEM